MKEIFKENTVFIASKWTTLCTMYYMYILKLLVHGGIFILLLICFLFQAAFITVKELMQGNSQVPYTKSFKVLVVCKDPEKMYVNEAKEERFLINCVVADATKAVKCTVYDRTKFSRFQEGNTIIIRNVIKKTDNIVVTANSKVFPTGNIEVPQDVVDEGRRLLHPPAAEVKTVAEAVSSPPRVRVSVQGKLTQVCKISLQPMC